MVTGLNSNKNEILIKAVKVFIVRVLGYGCGFFFIWVIANKYGSKTQGIFSIAFLFLSVGVMISKLGVETSIIKWIANSKSKAHQKYIYYKSIKVVAVSSIIVAIIIYVLAPLVAKMYNKPDVLQSIQLAAFGVPFLTILDVSSNFFSGKKRTTTFSLYYHFGKFLLPLLWLIYFYWFEKRTMETPMMTYVIGLISIAIIVKSHIFYLFTKIKWKAERKLSTRRLLLESYPMLVASSIVLVMGWSDIFILGFFVSEEEIGVYSTSVKLATIVSFAYNAIATIATPKIAEYFHEKNQKKLNETVSFSARTMFICSFPIFSILFIFPEFFLSFFGQEYVMGKDVLRILLIAQLTNVFTGPVGPIFQMTNQQSKLQHFILISLAVNIVLSLTMVSFLRLNGVAIGSALGMIVWNSLGARYIFRKMKLKSWVNFNI